MSCRAKDASGTLECNREGPHDLHEARDEIGRLHQWVPAGPLGGGTGTTTGTAVPITFNTSACPHGHAGAQFCPACASIAQHARQGPLGIPTFIPLADQTQDREAMLGSSIRNVLEEIGAKMRRDADDPAVNTWAAVEQSAQAVTALRSVIDYLRDV